MARTGGAVATAVLAAALGLGLLAGAPAGADTRAMPGSFTGFGFDTCDAPSQAAMDAWRRHSVFAAVGIYVAGINRACATQPHLDRGWVRRQAQQGWRLLPLVVGRQAACAPPGFYQGRRISARPADRYARARSQGRSAADAGVAAVRRLGIGRGSVVWYDLEHFDIGRRGCRRSALAFVSAWTRRLHALHHRSGFYSSASSGITMLDQVRRHRPGRFTLPDYLWVAEWDGRRTVRSSYVSQDGWWPHRRVHQYRGGHRERHGHTTIEVDSNYLSTGRGTRAGRPARHCGVRVDFRAYRRLTRGHHGPQVQAAQCLLRLQGWYDGRLTGRFGRPTGQAVARLERSVGLRRDGRLGARTWTALLSEGRNALVKYGSGGRAVRRLQRSLNVAVDAHLVVDGIFARAERRAVRRYQWRVGRDRTGVVTARLWRALEHGRVAGARPARRLLTARAAGPLDRRGLDAGHEHSSGALHPFL